MNERAAAQSVAAKRSIRAGLAALCLASLAALAGCGVDGAPQPPSGDQAPGVQIHGEARVGVAGSF